MKKNKQDLYIFIIMIGLIGLTIGYAALSSTLNINGKSSISKNTWDVYFDNVVVKDGSVEAVKVPTVTNKTTVDFEVALNLPGDFYEFTVDVVNDGTIDAMIESVEKTPELSEAQQKYLNYIIEYQNGEQINTKQLVNKESFVRLKVKVELRKDIDASDLPEVGDVLYLGFTVNYVQADNSGVTVNNNGLYNFIVVSGDLDIVGSELTFAGENFHVIASDDSTVTMLAKYNLFVGNECDGSSCTSYGDEATGLQDSTMRGKVSGETVRKGTIKFAPSVSWSGNYAYNSNTYLYGYIENYKSYLESLGANILEARLMTKAELNSLGCLHLAYSCSSAPEWIYYTSFWSGAVGDTSSALWNVYQGGQFTNTNISYENIHGVRPVLVVSKDCFE